METTKEETIIVIFSQESNDGKGGWKTNYPEEISNEDLDDWFERNRYNSMVSCCQFNSMDDAIESYNEATLGDNND